MSRPLRSTHDLDSGCKESLLSAILTQEGREKVVSLRGDDAEVALTLMQMEFDASGSQHDSTFRTQLSRVVLRLVASSHRVPANLWLADVQDGEEKARGGYGVVNKGSWEGKEVALKFPHNSATDHYKNFFREVIVWRQLNHKNVLPFLGLYRDGPRKAMVSPWQSGGNVVDFIRDHPGADRHTLLIQVTNGLSYLHEFDPPIIHSDLKPENILISHEKIAMLADFGLSHVQHNLTESLSSDHFGVRGTIPYCAPELFRDTPSPCKPSTSRDIWALGMVIYRLFTGEVPFADRPYPKGTCDAITSGTRPKQRKYHDKQLGFTDELWGFLENDCWKMSQEERPSARHCVKRFQELRSRWKVEKAAKLALRSQDLVEEIIEVPPKYCRALFDRRKPYLQSLVEQFGVRIVTGSYTKIKVWGDRINVQTAIKDIIDDCKNFTAPHKITSLSVPSRLRGSIIGKDGKSVKALGDEYSVKIHFSNVSEEVTVKGPPDNVDKAKDTLQSIVEYLQLYNDICDLQVNEKIIARLRSSIYLQEIREKLGLRELRIHSDTSILMRGPRRALQSAETHFYRLQEEIDRETTLTLTEDINQIIRLVKGQVWSEIVRKCDGPVNPILQRALVTVREEEKEVILTGDGALIQRLRDQLVLEVEQRREIVFGMEIPHDFHRDLLREHNISSIHSTAQVFISFPGGEAYRSLPEPQNLYADDLSEVDEQDIVKIKGTREACKTARQILKERIEDEKRLRLGVWFGAKYYNEILRSRVLDQLKSMGIRVLPLFPPPCPLEPRIDLAPLPKKPWISWGQSHRYDPKDKEDCGLALRAQGKELMRAKEILTSAVQKVSAASHIGYLKFSPDTTFGRLIGTNGATVRRLQTETNTDIKINGPDNPCTVKIIGSRKNVKRARDKVLRLLDSGWNGGERDF